MGRKQAQAGSGTSVLEIKPLTGLRGICAIWVMLFHAFFCEPFFGTPLDWVLAAGYMGVDVFFVLSGYVLAYTYAHSTWTLPTYFSYIRKRFARIYPVHAFMLLVFVVVVWLVALAGYRLLPADSTKWFDLLRSLLLVHAVEAAPRFPWNGPSWTISAEWAAYIAFPLVAWIALRIRSVAVAAMLVVLLYALYAMWGYYPAFSLGSARRIPQLATNFCAGVVLWRLASLTSPKPYYSKFATLSLALLILGASAGNMFAGAGVAHYLFAIAAAALVFFAAGSEGSVARFLSTPVMLHLGRISYSLYLVHMLFMHLSDILIRKLGSPWSIRIAAVGCAVIAAHFMYRWIEEPCRRAIVGSRAPAPDSWFARDGYARASCHSSHT